MDARRDGVSRRVRLVLAYSKRAHRARGKAYLNAAGNRTAAGGEIMPGEKIQIQWDDLKTRKVDQRLREQEALERNRRQADGQLLDTEADQSHPSASIWYNAIFTMAMFGLLGGLMAWGA